MTAVKDMIFLAHRIPYPPDRGDKIRSWHLLKHLASLARVHLACFADDEADAANLPALRRALGGRLGEAHVEIRTRGKAAAGARALVEGRPVSLALFDSARLRGFVARRLAGEGIGTIFAFSGQMAQFVPEGVRQRFVMDFGDVDSAKFAQYADEGAGPMRWVNRREGEKLFAFERATAARADLCLFVSEAEASLFRSMTGLANIKALSNGIDVDHFDPAAAFPRLGEKEKGQGPLLLFTGQMDYAPNVQAASWFAREVLPNLPGARFAIAGRSPLPAVRALAGEQVIVTGAVADMRAWLDAASVVVAPLKLARGIQNKVLEAMAMAKPVVASPAAFEGIEALPGRDLLVADDAEATAAAIEGLLAAPDRAAAMGAAARRQMERSYRWEARLAPLAAIVDPGAHRKAA
jgi:sugar transferase (PEP-CTERM/EpsH1 system associated)